MELREAIIQKEKEKVAQFLNQFSLNYDFTVDTTIYLVDNDKIVGTVSKSEHIIKCLAVDPSYQNENLASTLISRIIEILQSENRFYYQVFTKSEYERLFINFGFTLLAKTNTICMLEGGMPKICDTIKEIRQKIANEYGEDIFKMKIGSIVMNANPLTNGHLYLIEHASKHNDLVLVFILEEEKSLFSFKERFALVYMATRIFQNVMILPSTRYIISKDTFPNYFLKEVNIHAQEYAKIDALIFKNYFMSNLGISTRYVGTETDPLMMIYNNTLKEELAEQLEIVERISQDDQVISASLVRKLLQSKQIDEALVYLPKSIHFLIRTMAYDKFCKN